MLSNLVTSGTKALGGSRFSLVNVLPGTLLAATVLVTVESGAYGTGPASLGDIVPSDKVLTAGRAVVLIFALFVAGVLIQPFQVTLVQYIEGYWDRRLGRSVGAIAIELHRRRFLSSAAARRRHPTGTPTATGLAQVVAYARAESEWDRRKTRADRMRLRYPDDPERFMPTMLGNILRDGEDTAGERYGLDAMTAYPRMYPTVSKPLSDAMARQLDLIALTSSMSVSFALGALATAPVVRRGDWWSLIPLIALGLSVLSYRGALRAAESHGTLLATTFDLHRFDMLRALHYELPKTVSDELKFNEQLTTFLQGKHVPHPSLAKYPYDHSIYDQLIAPEPTSTTGGDESATEPKKNTGEESATAPPSSSPDSPNPQDQGC